MNARLYTSKQPPHTHEDTPAVKAASISSSIFRPRLFVVLPPHLSSIVSIVYPNHHVDYIHHPSSMLISNSLYYLSSRPRARPIVCTSTGGIDFAESTMLPITPLSLPVLLFPRSYNTTTDSRVAVMYQSTDTKTTTDSLNRAIKLSS